MSENKKENIDLFKVVATYQMNELPSLILNFLIVSFWITVAIVIFIGIDLGFHFIINFLDIPLDNYSLKFDSLVDYINDLSEKYFLGKFGLWGSIIFIFSSALFAYNFVKYFSIFKAEKIKNTFQKLIFPINLSLERFFLFCS